MADSGNDGGAKSATREAFDNIFRQVTREDEVQQMLRRVREVSQVGVSSTRFIQERILAKDQFLDRQRGFFNLGAGELERGLTGEQHKRIFDLAFDQAFQSFGPEDRRALESVLTGKGTKAFSVMDANARVGMLEQSLKEGKQTKLLIQLVNRGRRSIRPTAKHFAAHYGTEAETAHRIKGLFPSTLGMAIPLAPEEGAIISTEGLDATRKDPGRLKRRIASISKTDAGLGAEFERYFKGIAKVDNSLGIHTGFQHKQNTFVEANRASGAAAQYHLKFKYDNRDVTLRIPIITGNNAKIGYTGDNLNVRRIMTPVRVVETGQANMTHSVMQRNQYYLAKFNEEVLPLMERGEISGRELREYVKNLDDIFIGQDIASGRAHTANQSFFQTRYERERGAMAQLVTKETGGLKRGNVTMAYASLNDQQTLRFLNVWKDNFGVDVSESRFTEQGVVSEKSRQKVGGLSVAGDLAAHEFADPRVTEHARLDQKIRKRTMSAESVVAAYKGSGVQQREWQAFGNLRFTKQIDKWGTRKDWGIGITQRDELKDLIKSKRLNFEDLKVVKAKFKSYGKQKDYKSWSGVKRFGLLTEMIHNMDARPDAAGLRQRFTNFLTPQELVLYGMAEVDKDGNLKRFATLDNKSMLPPGEARYEEMDSKRLGKARELLMGLQKDIVHGGAIKRGQVDVTSSPFVRRRAEEMEDATKSFFGRQSKQAVEDAGFLLATTKQLPYTGKRDQAALGKIMGIQLGVGDDLSSLIPEGKDPVEEARRLLKGREEVLQVGTMYVDPEKMGGKGALHATTYFGSGEGIMKEKMKHLLSTETTMNKSLTRLNPEAFELEEGTKIVDGTFKSGGFSKDSNGQYRLKEKSLKMKSSIIAWDSRGREVLYDKKMRNLQFSEMDANDGSSGNKWLLMEYDELIRPESHVKLHGDIKQGVSFVKGGVKKWKEIAGNLASMLTKDNVSGRWLLGLAGRDETVEGITQMQFKHGRRAHQHIRQIATAMSMTMQDHVGKGFGAGDDELRRMAGAPIKGVAQSPVDFIREKFSLDADYKGNVKAYQGSMKEAHTAQVQKMMNWYMEKALGSKERGVHGKDTDAYLYDEKKFAKIFGLTGTVFGENKYDEQGKLVKKGLSERMVEEAFELAAKKAGIAPASKGMIQAYIEAAQSGAAFGVARQHTGDAMSMQGAGKMGTLEGRSMLTMTQGAFGERGEEMAMDFLKRMKTQDLGPEGSEKWRVREELQRSLKTIMEPTAIPKRGAAVIDLTGGGIESSDVIKRMTEQGQNVLTTGEDVWLKTGANKGVYLPSSDLPGMAEKTIETGKGEIKASAVLRNTYTRFVQDVASGVPIQDAMGDLQDAILPHSAEFSKKGMGGVLKGALPGSRSLIASSRAASGETMKAANVVGLSRKNIKGMVKEMLDTGLYTSKEDIAQIKALETTLEAGGTVGGIIARHPFISSHSLQKILFKQVDTPDDALIVPEISVDIHGGKTRLKLGAMLGLAGDYDFDAIIAAFVDPTSEKTISREMDFKKSSDYYERYMQHQIRYQTLKTNETGATTNLLSNVEDAAGKMQVKKAYVGRLSNEMTKVKFAAASYLSEKKVTDIFALTEWLEQKPISSKHLNPKDLEKAMSRLVGAFEGGAKNKGELYNAIASFIDEDSTKDVVLSQEDVQSIKAGTGYQIKTKFNQQGQVVIKGFDLRQIAGDIFNAQARAKQTQLPERLQTFKGTTRGGTAARAWQEMSGAAAGGMGRAASIADQVLSNIMGAAGQSGILHHRGIQTALAVGSLVGLANVLSQPREMVGPGKHLDSRARMNMSKGTKRIKKDDVKPPRAPIGTPTSPSMLSQRRAMISAKPVETNHFVVRARAEYPDDVALISQQLQQFTSLGNSVNISVRDSRGIPNRYADSNKAY